MTQHGISHSFLSSCVIISALIMMHPGLLFGHRVLGTVCTALRIGRSLAAFVGPLDAQAVFSRSSKALFPAGRNLRVCLKPPGASSLACGLLQLSALSLNLPS